MNTYEYEDNTFGDKYFAFPSILVPKFLLQQKLATLAQYSKLFLIVYVLIVFD